MHVAILPGPFFFVFFHFNCCQLNESLFLPLISCRKAKESYNDIMQNLLSFSYLFYFYIDLIQCYPGYLVPELINNYLSTFQPALFFFRRTRDRVDQVPFEFSIANGILKIKKKTEKKKTLSKYTFYEKRKVSCHKSPLTFLKFRRKHFQQVPFVPSFLIKTT